MARNKQYAIQLNQIELLRYGKNEHIKEYTSYYSPNETTIEQTQCVKDLVIKMSVTLSFTDYINTICSKVRLKCWWIMRTCHTRDMHTTKTLWCSIAQPHIDYCSQLWTPTELEISTKLNPSSDLSPTKLNQYPN